MIILKLSTGTNNEHEVKIVDHNGTWQSGIYHIYSSGLQHEESTLPETDAVNSTALLGEMNIDKENGKWSYNGDKLSADEQQEVAAFIIDYRAPDGVY